MAELKRAACGLDCNTCNLYLAGHDPRAAAALVDWFRSRGWIGPEEGAEAVQRQAPFCHGCWDVTAKQWCGECHLRACCTQNARAHCGECSAFPCAEYQQWTVGQAHHLAAMEMLLAEKGNPPTR